MRYELISQNSSLSPIEQILTNRGIKLEDINHYLNTTDNDILEPKLLMNVHEGAKMLFSHIAQKDTIYMIVDPDVDGYTSAALFINYLNAQFPGYAQNYIYYTMHDGKQHGLIESDINDVLEHNAKLVIMIDSSSNDYDLHKRLKDKDIDILVIDHHEADQVSQNACVINNQLCDYPTKSLSGVGVAYKFCSYLDELIGESHAHEFEDLVAVGVISDMMELRDFETRQLVTRGLNNLRNPYIKEIRERNAYSIDRAGGLNPFSVSFFIAPYVNATIRIGSQQEKLILFESMLDYRGYELIPSTKRGCKGQVETRVEQACRNCNNLKNKQTKARDASLDAIKFVIEDQNLLKHKVLAIRLPKELETEENLTGLIANELASEYQRPILLLNEKYDENGELVWRGSGRNYANSQIENLREWLLSSQLVDYAQGHGNAFGISIYDSEFNDFISWSDNQLKDFDFSPCYKVDFIFQGADFKGSDILKIAELKSIWGRGVEEALIAIENIHVNISNIQLLSKDRNPTLKITLNNGVDLLKFRSSEEEFEKLTSSDLGCVNINVVGKCDRNEWNGRITPQIHVEEYEIVGVKKYYF